MAAGSQHRRVFVGNIPYDATEEQLIQICEEVGPVVSFRLVLDRETGKPKGYGFCEYKDEETALSARRNLQGYEINGRQLRVDFAENDKGADRNREQGRGGPGLTANIDAQKSLVGPSILGDSTLHQPVGLPLAVNAAFVMAEALSGTQTASLPSVQNVLPSQSGVGNDPLTHYLSKMSKHQLNGIISEMKALATQNKALTQQLLQQNSQLPKALFQVLIMLGMVSPQMLQMASIQQASAPVSKASFQDGIQDQKPLLSSHPGQTPVQKEARVGIISRPPQNPLSNVAQNSLMLQPSVSPFQHVPIQPQVQKQLPPQDQVPLAGTVPGISGIPKVPIRPQSLGGPSQQQTPPLPSSKGLIPQIQATLLQHHRPVGTATIAHHPQTTLSDAILQQTIVPQPLTPQSSSSNYPVLLSGLETFPSGTGAAGPVSLDSTRASGINRHPSSGVGLVEHAGIAGSTPDLIDRPSKLAKLDDGSAAPQMVSSSTSTFKHISSQSAGPASFSGSPMVKADGPQPSDEQFPPDVQSALWQQVMSLTPEQLSSLPREQQEQVFQLQKALQQQVMNLNPSS